MSGCISSNNVGDFLWKARKAVDKDLCEALLRQVLNHDMEASQEFPENIYPAKIPDLREKINASIDKAMADCTKATKKMFILPTEVSDIDPVESDSEDVSQSQIGSL